MKLKTKRTVQEELEVEIDFPAYFQTSIAWIKILSEFKGIWINNTSTVGIEERREPLYYYDNKTWQPSTPEEFNAALEAAINHINELNK